MAKPVVSTDVGDVSFYVRDGYNGFIVEVGNAHALKERVSSLIDDEGTRREFGHKARKIAVSELDITMCAQLHLEAYKQVLGIS